MNSFERGWHDNDPGYNPESKEREGAEQERNRENDIDLRLESELFKDHERPDGDSNATADLARLRDTLVEDQDGILYLKIPEYDYDFATNPFVGMGPQVRRTYAVSRYLDVVFLHRFMYHDILVCGIRSREFVDEKGRASLVKHVRDTGGVPLRAGDVADYDLLALKFAPYVASDTTAAWFARYHKQEPYLHERPHLPVDVWAIYDAGAYERVDGQEDFRKAYQLKPGYNRRSSLLGIAQIN